MTKQEAVFWVVAISLLFFIIGFLVSRIFTYLFAKSESIKQNQNHFGYTGEAVRWNSKCLSDFQKLVITIAFYRLKQNGQKIGVEEDMKNAFLEAIKAVHSVNSYKMHSGSGAVRDRIQELIKRYETP